MLGEMTGSVFRTLPGTYLQPPSIPWGLLLALLHTLLAPSKRTGGVVEVLFSVHKRPFILIDTISRWLSGGAQQLLW